MITSTTKLYDGEIVVNFNNKARNRYLIGTHSPLGVTTILGIINKPGLMTWTTYENTKYLRTNCNFDTEVGGYIVTERDLDSAQKAYMTKSDKGKDTGTLIHGAIEALLNNETPNIPTEIQKPIKSFLNWFNQHEISPMAVEQIVYSKKHDFCGTYDSLLEIDGKVTLVDIKTSNSSRTAPRGVYAENFLQLGAYSLAHHEENPLEEIEQFMVVRVGKDGKLFTMTNEEFGDDVKNLEAKFLDALSLYRWKTLADKKIIALK